MRAESLKFSAQKSKPAAQPARRPKRPSSGYVSVGYLNMLNLDVRSGRRRDVDRAGQKALCRTLAETSWAGCRWNGNLLPAADSVPLEANRILAERLSGAGTSKAPAFRLGRENPFADQRPAPFAYSPGQKSAQRPRGKPELLAKNIAPKRRSIGC